MITTPNMGLVRWDQPNDVFSYTELSDNFNLLDVHDHASGNGVQIPTAGLANLAVTETKIANDAVTAAKIADGTVGAAELATAAKPATLLAPWRTIASAEGQVYQGTPVGARIIGSTPASPVPSPRLSGDSVDGLLFGVVYIDPNDYLVTGLTTKLRTRVVVSTNGTAPAITFTAGLYPVTFSGGVGLVIPTLGTVVSGSTAAVVSPSASTSTKADSSDYNVPSAGTYALGVAFSGTTANNSFGNIVLRLAYRHV